MILYLHSILRYLVLILAAVVAIQSLIGLVSKGTFKKGNRMTALFLMIGCDVQLLLGFILYYTKVIGTGMLSGGNVMKDPYIRFYAMEHAVSMILGIVLVHLAFRVAKKTMDDGAKFKKILIFSGLAFVLFFAMIPWEGKKNVGRPNIPQLNA